MKLETLHITQINTAWQCEKKLYFVLTQPKLEKMPVRAWIGWIFHSVLEEYFKNKAKGQILDWKGVEAIFKEKFQKNANKCDFKDIVEEQTKQICRNYLFQYYQKRCGVLFPRSEKEVEIFFDFRAKKDEQSIILKGTADLICKDGTCVDHKTGRTNKDWISEPQAYLYPLGLKTNGIEVSGFQFSVVNKDSVQVFDVPFNQQKTNEILAYCFNLQKAFQEENLFTNYKNCRFCEYQNLCEGG